MEGCEILDEDFLEEEGTIIIDPWGNVEVRDSRGRLE